ncbi:MAG: hypothetical protein JJU28_22965 [Cyclobacteriaceae bacterium]|nr:hypothetical protein [Cyclobacteriaceae bacterium]
MKTLTFNNIFSTNTFSNTDVLSAFKQEPEKPMTIKQGMSAKEISEVVSEKVIAVVKEQFHATKEEFKNQAKKNS